MKMQIMLCCDQSQAIEFPTSDQADQSSLGAYCIAKDRGASLCDQ